MPSGVHSAKVTSATSSGSSQVVGRCSGGFSTKGMRLRSSFASALESVRDALVVEA